MTNSLNFYLWNKNSQSSSSTTPPTSIQTTRPTILPSLRNVVWPAQTSVIPNMFDTIFIISTGLVTSYYPKGMLRWQTETIASWPVNANSPPPHPSITAFSPRVGQEQ